MNHQILIGTAGWSIPSAYRPDFPRTGTQLERYAARFDAVEINSSFYRPHRRATYERWTATVPSGFRFSVKLPKAITHERRLLDCAPLLDRFADEVGGLGEKLGALLMQLPPSLGFDPRISEAFFAALRSAVDAPLLCEPRHPDWFTKQAETMLRDHRIARVAADPAPAPGAERSGGWTGLRYLRLHGTPVMYRSSYDHARLLGYTSMLNEPDGSGQTWCIFDNTASGAAVGNARDLRDLVGDARG